MTKILVLYYSMYGHIEIMAKAVAEGVRSANADVVIKRVPDTMSPEVAKQYGAKLEQEAPFATPDELPQYDAIIFGTPTRFGNMAGQMRNFLDQTGSLWLKGALIGKVGSVFTSTGTGGGNESTILTFIATLLHHGMITWVCLTPFLRRWILAKCAGAAPTGPEQLQHLMVLACPV